jgi:hypothetical protein
VVEPTRPSVHPVLLIPMSWPLPHFTQSSDATRIGAVGSPDGALLLFPCVFDLFLCFFHLPSLDLNIPSFNMPSPIAMHMLTCIWYVNLVMVC